MKNRSLLKHLILYIFLILSNLLAGNKIIIQPDGGGEYSVGAMTDIKWLTTQETDSITIEYTTNSGNDWVIIDTIPQDTSDTTTYYWTIPAIKESSDNCKIRLKNTTTDTVSDESDEFFTIRLIPATIELVQPEKNKKISLNTGQMLEIKWSITGYPKIDSVNIDMSINNGTTWIVVASNISGQSTYSIYIPYIPDSETIDGGLIKISDAANPDKYFDDTDVPFSIIKTRNPIKYSYYKSSLTGTPSIKTDIVSQTLNIKFSTAKRENVNIDFFSLNGVRIHTIDYGHIEKGTHSIQYDYRDLISGCFILKIIVGDEVFIKSIIHPK